MLSGGVSKICISLPPQSMMQLDYLADAWHMPPTVKRSQLIQQAIWHAFVDAQRVDGKTIVDSDNVDDYIL